MLAVTYDSCNQLAVEMHTLHKSRYYTPPDRGALGFEIYTYSVPHTSFQIERGEGRREGWEVGWRSLPFAYVAVVSQIWFGPVAIVTEAGGLLLHLLEFLQPDISQRLHDIIEPTASQGLG